jgi:RNA polymerase sigma-70 factor (ECF subfamily)
VPDDDPTPELVQRARRGDAAAFEALVRRHLRPAYSIALAIVARPSDAEDVAQEAMIIACERIDTCREPSRFGAWLFQIVRNHAKNWLAKRRLRDVSADPAPPEATHSGPGPDAGAFRAPLLAALEQLAAAEREVVLLHDLDGWTHLEIAAALGISVVMSRQHLFQARRRLRSEFAPPGAGEAASVAALGERS